MTIFGQQRIYPQGHHGWPVDAGRAFTDVYIEKRPAEAHPAGQKNPVNPV